MSPRESYDPFKDESLIAPPRKEGLKKTRIRVDWKRGAEMLARGEPAETIASALGISTDRLWKHFHKSLRFQFLFRQNLERLRVAAQLAFEEQARRAVIERCGRVAEIDATSWQWLASQGGIAAEPRSAEESATHKNSREFRLAAALKDAGREAPNQALRERIRKERKVMDAQFAELKAWGRANGILPPEEKTTDKKAEPPRSDADQLQLSENKTQISSNKTQVSIAEPRMNAESEVKSTAPALSPAVTQNDSDDIRPNTFNVTPGLDPRVPFKLDARIKLEHDMQSEPTVAAERSDDEITPASPQALPIMPRHLLGSVTDLTDGDGVPLPQTDRHARA